MSLNTKAKIVVTGAAGFIGSNLCDALIVQGFEVFGIDNLFSGKKENIEHLAQNKNFHFFEGDIRDSELLNKITKDAYAVFHQAAVVSVPLCSEAPELAVSVNIDAFTKVLMSAAQNKVSRFIYASSCAVYGDQGNNPIKEDAPLLPMSLYAVSKETNEKIAQGISKSTGIITNGLRYFNVYGPKQDPKGPYAGVIAKFNDLINSKQTPTIWGTGEQSRDFVFVEDLVNVLMLLLKTDEDIAKKFPILNVASGTSTNILQLWDLMKKIKACSSESWTKPHFEARRNNDILHSKASLEKLHQFFQLSGVSFKPKSLEQGLSHLLLKAKTE